MEDRIRESEQRYRSLVENLPVVSWESDEHRGTTFISGNVEQVYGYGPQEIYDRGEKLWLDRIHPEDQEKVGHAFQRLLCEGTPFDVEYRIQRKDGQWIWLQDRSGYVYGKDGVRCACGAFLDISERKRVEEALQESEEKFSKAFHNNPNIMMLVDGQTRTIVDVNHAYIYKMGYPSEEIVNVPGKLGHALAWTETGEYPLQMPQEADHVSDYEVVLRAKQGKELNFLVFAEPMDIRDRHLHLITLIDITDRKTALRKVEESEQQFRTLAENIPGVVYRCRNDANWTTLFMSDAIEDLSRYPASQFVDHER
ncbi:PAS domain S-box protein, partial [archaeon]|nr:PAS domain S-box protein [archaeon]